MSENQMGKYEAEEQAEQMKQKVSSGETRSYDEAEKNVEREYSIKRLEMVLEQINSRANGNNNFHNSVYFLLELGMKDLAEKIFTVFLKTSLETEINAARFILDPQNSQSLEASLAIGRVIDVPAHMANTGGKLGIESYTYRVAADFVSAVYESENTPRGYEHAIKMFILSDRHATRPERYAELKRLKESCLEKSEDEPAPELNFEVLTKAAKRFLEEIENDPILQLDEQTVIDEVKKGIEQKLQELETTKE